MSDESATAIWRFAPMLIAAAIAVALFMQFVLPAMGAGARDLGPYYDKADDWCDERNGELYTSYSVSHGGLHCELPDGTQVHMWEVIEVDESDGG